MLAPGPGGGLGLNLRSEAMWVGTRSERTAELLATEAGATRLRLVLQGERTFATESGHLFRPTA